MKQTWRLLLRTAVFQCAFGLLGALVGLALNYREAASAFLLGVAVITVSTLIAATLGLRRAESPLDSLSKVLGANLSKWLLISVVLYLALSRWQFAALPLVLGVIAAQLSALVVGLCGRRF